MQPITHTTLAHPTLAHGFFTRLGGVSTGIYASLNCGPGSADEAAHVEENRARVARAMGAAPTQLVTCYQVHSPTVVEVTAPFAQKPEADAMVSKTHGVVLGILTADCAPVLFADVKAGVIGAAHAGWKGAVGGVLENTVKAMETLGAARANITAVIGPCIGPESYEVGEEFVQNLLAQDAAYAAFFTATEKREGVSRTSVAPEVREQEKGSHTVRQPFSLRSAGGTKQEINAKFHFNLPAFVQHRLKKAGVEAAWVNEDTLSQPEKFFSYRRKTLANEADYGRQISAIMLRG